MLAQRLIALIETHADALTRTVLTDLAMDPRTRSLQLPQDELEARVFAIYRSLGEWIGEANYLARGYEDEAARQDAHAEAVAGRRRGTRMAHERQSLYEC